MARTGFRSGANGSAEPVMPPDGAAPISSRIPAHSVSTGGAEGNSRGVLPLYAATLFLSALLLFLVQPVFTKMVLPLFGGSPTVWATAMVFFQASLLAGYLYAHLIARRLSGGRQAILHLAVLALAAASLPWPWPRAGRRRPAKVRRWP